METFKIELERYSYCPGDEIGGRVLISTSHSIPAKSLKIRAEGKSHTEWTQVDGKDKKKQEKKSIEANFTHLSTESIAWTPDENSSSLPPGEHEFQFCFELPDNCPPSFEGSYGHVRYAIHVELAPDYRIEKRISVQPTMCLNNIPAALSPIISFVSKNTGWLARNGLVFMTVTLPKQVFTSREVIPILVSIENDSKKSAISVMSRMTRNHHYKASNHRKTDFEEIATSHRQISISPKGKGQLELTLKVPNTVCSFQSELIGVEYCIQVKLGTMSLFGSSVSCDFEVVVGNVPRATRVMMMVEEETLPSQPPEYSSLLDSSGLPPSYEDAVNDK